jgi:hypothetical protein
VVETPLKAPNDCFAGGELVSVDFTRRDGRPAIRVELDGGRFLHGVLDRAKLEHLARQALRLAGYNPAALDAAVDRREQQRAARREVDGRTYPLKVKR